MKKAIEGQKKVILRDDTNVERKISFLERFHHPHVIFFLNKMCNFNVELVNRAVTLFLT